MHRKQDKYDLDCARQAQQFAGAIAFHSGGDLRRPARYVESLGVLGATLRRDRPTGGVSRWEGSRVGAGVSDAQRLW
ncbi:MAG: hypothetical protein KDA61_01440 [Planctomycetales bacterium]|nr:hypothetical protein [Planctomycetales bacterium]